ncbi:hypothetical protein AKG11_03715 [Shinella sp. SUS2]|nr:hypothetical protein AKG11_03715 [Shinella sp. SUS2]KOC77445.1 hypothetical protein AKG10_01185 [Shinella sp. GWS1]
MDLLARQAEFGGRSWTNIVPNRNDVGANGCGRNLTPFLRRVIFIGQPPFGGGLDLQRVGLRAVRLGDRLNSVSSGCNYFVCI